MRPDLLELADRLYTGEAAIEEFHPMRGAGELVEVQPAIAFVQAFANSSVFATPDGLVAVDTSGILHAARVHESVRAWSPARLDTAVFTHGHIDHVFGVEIYE
jgi:glyoxylase-like metal-dependent hydrolase (beta-lactamase superfamily II)